MISIQTKARSMRASSATVGAVILGLVAGIAVCAGVAAFTAPMEVADRAEEAGE
jgi:hypothetical protein